MTGTENQLTAGNVREVVLDSLFKDEEVAGLSVEEVETRSAAADGVMIRARFNPERLERNRARVAAMLLQLPDEFMRSGGGGMSFLNAPFTREGVHWGEHRDIDSLLSLGLALDLASFSLPRDYWQSLPGGMPYFVVDDAAARAAVAEGRRA